MCTAVLFLIAKKGKPPNCPATDRCVHKVRGLRTMGYYLAVTGNDVLITGCQRED